MNAHPAIGEPLPTAQTPGGQFLDHAPHDTHTSYVESSIISDQDVNDTHAPVVAGDGWLELRIWAEQFHDIQQQRIAATNRAERGGVDPVVFEPHLEMLRLAERQCRLNLRRCYRRVVPESIRSWQKAVPGVGEDLLARLLGHLGHPVVATPHHWEGSGSSRTLVAGDPFERSVGQLWQFCGHGAPARKRKGMTADELFALGNPALKMLVHLNAEAVMKARIRYPSPLGDAYDEAKTAAADKTHTSECVRCGPSGKPAQIGSPWNAGHQHAHALRMVGKEMLRQLWIVAGGQAASDAHTRFAADDDPFSGLRAVS